MWAMALLYIGPRWKPGMEADYHVSPILAPSDLLAEFPPILLQCGGRDPLVDDTVLFAARVRQAKLSARGKAAAATRAATATAPLNGNAVHPDDECDDVAESVKMQIFPGWSHGYLQMSSIMREARVAIDDISDWITGTFERQSTASHHTATTTTVAAATATASS
jgi:acetyl esterase/lipase